MRFQELQEAARVLEGRQVKHRDHDDPSEVDSLSRHEPELGGCEDQKKENVPSGIRDSVPVQCSIRFSTRS